MGNLLTRPARLLGVLVCMTAAGFAASGLWEVFQTAGMPAEFRKAGIDLYITDPDGMHAEDLAGLPENTVYLCEISDFEETYREESSYSYVFSDTVTVYGFAGAEDARAVGFDVQQLPGAAECVIGRNYSVVFGYAAGDSIPVRDSNGEPFSLTVTEVLTDGEGFPAMLTAPETVQRMNGTDGFTFAFVDVKDDARREEFLDLARQKLPDAYMELYERDSAPPLLLYLGAGLCILLCVIVSGLLTWEISGLLGASVGALAGTALYQAVRPALLWQLAGNGWTGFDTIDSLPEAAGFLGCLAAAGAAWAVGGVILLIRFHRHCSQEKPHWGSIAVSMGILVLTTAGSLLGTGALERQFYKDPAADVTVQGLQGDTANYTYLRDLKEVRTLTFGYECMDTVETDGDRCTVWMYPSSDDMEDLSEKLGMDAFCIDQSLGRTMHLKPGDKVRITFRANSLFPIERSMTVLRYTDTPAQCKGGGIVVSPTLYRALYGDHPAQLYLNAAESPQALADVLRDDLDKDVQIQTAAQRQYGRHPAAWLCVAAAAVLFVVLGIQLLLSFRSHDEKEEYL